MSFESIMTALPQLSSAELKRIVISANKLLKQPKIYIRQIGKSDGGRHYTYLYATWQEGGKTRQKSLGKRAEADDALFGIANPDALAFIEQKQAEGFRIVA